MYKQIYDGDWIPVHKKQTIGCCDCDLIHEYKYSNVKGKLMMQITRNNRKTSQKRRYSGKGPKSVVK